MASGLAAWGEEEEVKGLAGGKDEGEGEEEVLGGEVVCRVA